MSKLTLQAATEDDLDTLAQLNKQLIEDEKHDNPMNVSELKVRMASFLNTEYVAYLFMEDGEVRGYTLVNRGRRPYYLRQFFICRDVRRLGYGKLAFDALMDAIGDQELDVEVMVWNEQGYRFWKAMGFEERSVYLRRGGR
ncbi:GNAT family N-acetyltransferase [Paenibacillus koleovorans]|uniref:GNAT family N-acetyltransferase n=1 Tax=Paenibacillus koleovorans TaxID=121608 RepID=UPI000FDC6C7B|nr:GNAT family N-acetyltransferase [Paenibacillus koleovorans]